MIDKEKQIEEMADTMCGSHSDYCERDGFPCEQGCRNGYLQAARRMYDAGYRKQVEGEWKDSDRNGVSIKGYMACSACDVMVPTVADGRYCLPRLRYCPNCGAKMVEEKTLEIKSERRDLTFGTGEPAVSHEKAVETVKEYVRLMEIAEMSKVACTSCEYDNNGTCDLLVTPGQCSRARCIAEAFYDAGYRKQFEGDVVEVVRCKDCAVPHNKWTGCPNLNGMIPPPDFFCARGERKQEEGEPDDR